MHCVLGGVGIVKRQGSGETLQDCPLSLGEIENPNAAGAGQLARISASGHTVSIVAVKKCKLATYVIYHCERTMRSVTPGNFTLDCIREV